MTVKIVTDSTADLPPALVQKLGIHVVPLNVHFGDKAYLDGVDLHADKFFQMLRQSPALPTTSPPSPLAFRQVYDALSKETDEIISIHISPKLSGTQRSALLAQRVSTTGCRIEVVDSQQASMGLGLIVLQAARTARRGAKLDEVFEVTNSVIPRTRFFGMLDTLEYLQKGGRIGKARALVGTLLNIKPIIGLVDGETHALGKARTRMKAMYDVVEMVKGFAPIEEMSVFHATTPRDAEDFTDQIASCFDKARIVQARIGPVIGTYLGPGGIGVSLISKAP